MLTQLTLIKPNGRFNWVGLARLLALAAIIAATVIPTCVALGQHTATRNLTTGSSSLVAKVPDVEETAANEAVTPWAAAECTDVPFTNVGIYWRNGGRRSHLIGGSGNFPQVVPTIVESGTATLTIYPQGQVIVGRYQAELPDGTCVDGKLRITDGGDGSFTATAVYPTDAILRWTAVKLKRGSDI